MAHLLYFTDYFKSIGTLTGEATLPFLILLKSKFFLKRIDPFLATPQESIQETLKFVSFESKKMEKIKHRNKCKQFQLQILWCVHVSEIGICKQIPSFLSVIVKS